jgi:hypothetical protein
LPLWQKDWKKRSAEIGQYSLSPIDITQNLMWNVIMFSSCYVHALFYFADFSKEFSVLRSCLDFHVAAGSFFLLLLQVWSDAVIFELQIFRCGYNWITMQGIAFYLNRLDPAIVCRIARRAVLAQLSTVLHGFERNCEDYLGLCLLFW